MRTNLFLFCNVLKKKILGVPPFLPHNYNNTENASFSYG